MGESDDNDTRIANGYNSHSVTSNNGSAHDRMYISYNPVALVDIDIQFDAVPIQTIKHQMRTSFDQSTHDESNLLLRACEKTLNPRRGCDTKCVSELTLEVSHELIIRIARATPGHR